MALLAALQNLVGDPDPSRPSYDREAFRERGDLDDDCIDTRHEVLQLEAVSFEMSANGCSVTIGEWWDPFTGEWFTDPRDLQLDHVVALGDAWASGAWAWTDDRRELFANSLANLNVIAGWENERKADQGPAGYRPSNAAARCAYLVQYGAVKAGWGLTIAEADRESITSGLAACDSVAAPSRPPAPATTSTTTTAAVPTTTTVAIQPLVPSSTSSSDCHPAYSPCLPNLPGNALNCGDLTSAQKPVTVLTPGVDPYALDRDGDGRGCEAG
ncbi:MAG: DUF1524 domain-containing protein [Acidimicrobiales bacterium]